MAKKVNNKIAPANAKRSDRGNSFQIICVGASAGGINAINELVSRIPADINAAIFIVLHLSKTAMAEILASRIKKNTPLECRIAGDNEPIHRGYIYLAPPDTHLLIKKDYMVLGHGPSENRFRPSIDVLFRSAAVAYGPSVTGIVLTGFLNDGTSGMLAIKQAGGHSVVQDPEEAEYPDMPLSVLETMDVDYCVSLKKMGDVLLSILNEKPAESSTLPASVMIESAISEKSATGIEDVSKVGKKTLYACPDCGGGLWSVENGREKHYRCHIGHAYSEQDLVLTQSKAIENTLWVAVRMMEERKLILSRMANENEKKGLVQLSNIYKEQSSQLQSHIAKLKELLISINSL